MSTPPSPRRDAVLEQVRRTRARLDGTAAGRLQRRVVELQLSNQALVLAALALMLFVPALLTLAVFLPVTPSDGLFVDMSRRLGLSAAATRAVQQLFASPGTIRSASSPLAAVFTVLLAYSWPATLQRGYETVWGLPSRGVRDRWRPVLWLVAFFVLVLAVAAVASRVRGPAGVVVTTMVGLPLTVLWSWWSQHLLLAGRVPWRHLLPGAVLLAAAMLLLRLAMYVYLSYGITHQYDSYGPIGVVFVLLSWFVAFSVVMLGAPLAGHVLHQHRAAAVSPALPPPAGLVPPPR